MIMSTLAAAVLITAATVLVAPATAQNSNGTPAMDAQASTPAASKKGHIAANGVNYYYEVYGKGEPLLLLHGGLGSIDMFAGGPVLSTLAAERQVIAVDLHGHGRTQLGSRAIDLVDIGNDLAIVLKELGYAQVDAVGYSFGGGAAFRLAVQHPAMVRRLVLVSAGFAQDGFHPEMLPMQAQIGAGMAEMMKNTPMYQSYAKVAPDVSEFPKLLDNMGALMRKPYNWAEDVKALKMPVMLVFGDSDMYRPEHVIEFYKLLGGGQRDAGWMREHMSQNRLAILPGLTHYDIFMSPVLAQTILPFVNGQSGVKSWAEQVKPRK